MDKKKETSRQQKHGAGVAEKAAETAERTGRAAQNTAERVARAGREATEGMSQQAAHRVERMAETQGEAFNDAMRDLSQNATVGADAMARSGSAVAKGMQELGRVWMDYAQEVMQQSVEATQNLMRSRTLTDVLQAQAEYMRASMESFMEQTSRISEISAKITAQSIQAGSETEEGQRQGRRRGRR